MPGQTTAMSTCGADGCAMQAAPSAGAEELPAVDALQPRES